MLSLCPNGLMPSSLRILGKVPGMGGMGMDGGAVGGVGSIRPRGYLGLTLLDMMATESGRASSPPKLLIGGGGLRFGRVGGVIDDAAAAASCCCRRSSCCCCFLLSLEPDVLRRDMGSPDLERRRKLKLERLGVGGALGAPSGMAGKDSVGGGGGVLPGVAGRLLGLSVAIFPVPVKSTDVHRG